MDLLTAIHTRRSIREFTADPVSDETVEVLLKAAMQAPSAGDERPWSFVVLRDRGILGEIARVHPYAGMLLTSPVAIVVCGDVRKERYEGHWVQDCSAATQNLLLAAHALGLGGVWVGVYPTEDRVREIRRIVGIPEPILPLCIIPVGHPAVRIPPEDRYDPRRVKQGKWTA